MSDQIKDPSHPTSGSVFSFRRMSGLDQAVMLTDWEWQNLDKLDPQIWMALSCPVHGLEFDSDTLKLLDADGDGRIRAQDVRDATAWVCQRVIHPASLRDGVDSLNPDELRDDTEEGKACGLALKLVMQKNGAQENNTASLEEIDKTLAEASSYPFNGDGVITIMTSPESENDIPPDMREYLFKAMSIIGGKRDVSGKPGLDQDLSGELEKRITEILAWRKELDAANLPLGEKTGVAWDLFMRLKPKFDDYFCRCRLVEFDPSALSRLEPSAPVEAGADARPLALNNETLLALPLAQVARDGKLNLKEGINPAWQADVATFWTLVQPVLPANRKAPDILDEKTWDGLKEIFGAYAAILEKKPTYPLPPADAEKVELPGFPELALAPADDPLGRQYLPPTPNETLAALSDAELEKLISVPVKDQAARLMDRDKAAPPLSSFQDLRKLCLFHAHLYQFMMNFLSFVDFYDPAKKAIFQEGVLYLDSRACLLCVPVQDVDTHARLAEQSHLCLLYCACERKAEDGAEQTGTIAAALTQGNTAMLIEGRHGLFIDNEGKEWDTKILRVAHNPISLREAMWAPYIRISNMMAEQIQKFVASKAEAGAEAAKKIATEATTPAQPKQSFDFAKGAGIFAAVSVAISVLSAAFAYIANSLVSLGWWWPLAVVGLFIAISGPSMLIAYFKLRRRSLGPLLDASGWAVNQGAPINLAMGAALTTQGKIPQNARRDLADPYGLTAAMRHVKARRRVLFWLLVLILLGIGGFALYCAFIYEPIWVTKLRVILGW